MDLRSDPGDPGLPGGCVDYYWDLTIVYGMPSQGIPYSPQDVACTVSYTRGHSATIVGLGQRSGCKRSGMPRVTARRASGVAVAGLPRPSDATRRARRAGRSWSLSW